MTNQQFCYWLQGYLEICQIPNLTKEKVIIIENSLGKIHEPLGSFTQWLSRVAQLFSSENYKQELLDFFLPVIELRLNAIFHHVIDNSYDPKLDEEIMQRIHDGIVDD